MRTDPRSAMTSLYDTLLEQSTVPGAYDAWADYRAALTAFLGENAFPGGSVLIVGAGACDDIDITLLAKRFPSVTLLDRDAVSLARAKQRCPAENVTVTEADLLGVSSNAYRRLDAMMQADIRAGRGGEALTDIFLSKTEALLAAARPDPLPQADTVVCCGVHSQLLALFARMAAVYARYVPLDLTAVFTALSRQNAALQPAFDARLRAAARHTLLTGIETGRVGTPGGIEGAAQALADASARFAETAHTELLWPFDASQGKIYTVRVSAFDTSKNALKRASCPC